jgi:hypothetical protein
MIARSYIESNLKQLDKLYNDAVTPKSKLYYSKLAMLELCGWIEESMDDIVQKCANRLLQVQAKKNYIADQIIGQTYGFEYKKHFMKMLSFVVGLINIEKLEAKLDPLKNARLVSALGTLKVARNREAHTHLKGVTRQVDSPSITINLFNHVFNGLKDIELNLKELSF